LNSDRNLYFFIKKVFINILKKIKMDFKKLAGQLLVVAGGVALYMLVAKPMLDKAKLTK